MMPSLSRRTGLLLVLSPALRTRPAHAQPHAEPRIEGPLLSAAQLRLGMERLVKLELERRLLDGGRAGLEAQKERLRVDQALRALGAAGGLAPRRAAQLTRAVQDARTLADALQQPEAVLLSESEALAVRLGFLTTALSAEVADPQQGALVDLVARAAASALRTGKLNLAAARLGGQGEVAVAARQSLTEFRSALEAVGNQALSARMQADLALARNQWLLFEATLDAQGLAKSPARLPEVASTTDRMAEALAALARRALNA